MHLDDDSGRHEQGADVHTLTMTAADMSKELMFPFLTHCAIVHKWTLLKKNLKKPRAALFSLVGTLKVTEAGVNRSWSSSFS